MKRLFFIVLLAGAGFADTGLDAAIGWLKSAQDQETGEINHYGVWGTAWGTIALAAYGEGEGTLNRSLGYIASSQNPDGGIPYEFGSPWGSGVDYSSPAILAFVYANKTLYSMAKNNKTPIDFIWGTQGANGGFGEWGEDVVSTSLAVIALSTTGENITKTGKDPVVFILSKQNPADGGFEWWTKSEATAQALLAHNSVGIYNQNTTIALYYLKSLQDTASGAVVDPYVTAISAMAFNSYGWNHEKELAVGYLKTVQDRAGRIGRTGQTQASDALTTALSALAFMNFSFGNVSYSNRIGANLSCQFPAPFTNETQTCTISVPQGWTPTYRYSIDGAVVHSDLPSAQFSGFSPGSHAVSAAAFSSSSNISSYTDIAYFYFTAIGPSIENPAQNGRYNLGDAVKVLVSNATNLSVFFGGTPLTGAITNLTYSARIENLTAGNYSLYFSSTGFSEHRNFTVSDQYKVQITNPESCTIGSPSQIAFGILGASGNTVSNATVFACLDGNCAQTDGSSYLYTCTDGSHTLQLNASKSGNTGSAEVSFTGATPPPSGGGGSYVTVEVEFPPNSGMHDISRALEYGECEYAYDCFAKAANIECSWWNAVAGLSCPGSSVSRTCLATGVDGIKASAGGWWSFYTNGALSAWGISCYKVKEGDRIKLKYAGDYEAEQQRPSISAPAPMAIAAIAPKNATEGKKTPPAVKNATFPALAENKGFMMQEGMGKAMRAAAARRTIIVAGAKAPCPTCDFASALLLKSALDQLNSSVEVTTDDRLSSCPDNETAIFIGGPAANRAVPASYWNATSGRGGAAYNIAPNCFVVAGNTRNLTSLAVSSLIETFK